MNDQEREKVALELADIYGTTAGRAGLGALLGGVGGGLHGYLTSDGDEDTTLRDALTWALLGGGGAAAASSIPQFVEMAQNAADAPGPGGDGDKGRSVAALVHDAIAGAGDVATNALPYGAGSLGGWFLGGAADQGIHEANKINAAIMDYEASVPDKASPGSIVDSQGKPFRGGGTKRPSITNRTRAEVRSDLGGLEEGALRSARRRNIALDAIKGKKPILQGLKDRRRDTGFRTRLRDRGAIISDLPKALSKAKTPDIKKGRIGRVVGAGLPLVLPILSRWMSGNE